jgi:hypothetical protein
VGEQGKAPARAAGVAGAAGAAGAARAAGAAGAADTAGAGSVDATCRIAIVIARREGGWHPRRGHP